MAFQAPPLHRTLAAIAAFPVAVTVMLTVNHTDAPPSPDSAQPVQSSVPSETWLARAQAVPLEDSSAPTALEEPREAPTAASPVEPEPAAPPPTATGPAFRPVGFGDTLKNIAAEFSTSVAEIASANFIADPDLIQVGRVLFIPAPGSTPGEPVVSGDAVAAAGAPNTVTAASLPNRAPRNSQEAFIFQIVPGAQVSQQKTRVPASVTIAQAILESSWGRSRLAVEAKNLFGIKAHAKPGPAGVVMFDTWEVENGENIMVNAPFRKYNTFAESIGDHGMFFVENSRYRGALAAADDAQEFARRINAAGYATDPEYASKLIGLMDRFDLYQYDAH